MSAQLSHASAIAVSDPPPPVLAIRSVAALNTTLGLDLVFGRPASKARLRRHRCIIAGVVAASFASVLAFSAAVLLIFGEVRSADSVTTALQAAAAVLIALLAVAAALVIAVVRWRLTHDGVRRCHQAAARHRATG